MNKQRKKPPVQLQGQDMRGTEEVSPRQKRPSRPRVDKIYGKHSVRALFMRRPDAVRRLVILSGKLEPPEEFLRLAEDNAIEPEVLPWTEFLRAAEVTKDDKHQGVCAFADPLTIYSEKHLDTLADASCILALDQITNPQNLATILRSAAFFGADAVLLLKNRAADMSPVVFRVAVGGAEFTKIFRVTNFARALDTLKALDFWVYGLDERGTQTLAETEFHPKTVLVVGAEGEGLRLRTSQFCDQLVRIPGGRPGIESLNAGVATSIALAELFRVRG